MAVISGVRGRDRAAIQAVLRNLSRDRSSIEIVAAPSRPQSALLSRLTGLPPDQVRLVLSVFLAAACEIVSALGFFAILPLGDKPAAQPKTTRPVWKTPEWRAPGTPQLGAKRPGVAGQAATEHDKEKPPVASRGRSV